MKWLLLASISAEQGRRDVGQSSEGSPLSSPLQKPNTTFGPARLYLLKITPLPLLSLKVKIISKEYNAWITSAVNLFQQTASDYLKK